MDFDKQLLKMSQEKGSAFTQITLEDDYIIPDVKPDVLKVIHTKGYLVFDAPKVSNHSLWVNGRMNFTVFYRSEDTQWKVDAATGSIPFQEKLSLDDVEETDEVHLKGNFEDISASLINSRKIAIRAVVDLEAKAEEVRWEEVVTGIAESEEKEDQQGVGESQNAIHSGTNLQESGQSRYGTERMGSGQSRRGTEPIESGKSAYRTGVDKKSGNETRIGYECKSSEKELLSLKLSQRDLLRIRKDLPLGQGLSNVLDIVYYDAAFMGVHASARDHAIELAGEVCVCVFYRGQGEEEIQLYEATIPLEGTLESRDLAATDICWIETEPEKPELEVHEDYDGEQRVLSFDFAFAITMHAWEEKKVPVLEDVYSLGCELAVTNQPVRCEHLLIYNQTKVRLAEQVVLDANQERMLSVCCADAQMVVEQISQKEAGLLVEGVLTVHLLYLSSDDYQPIGYTRGFLPVEQMIEIPQAKGTLHYHLRPDVEQLAVSLMDSGTYEVKATVLLEAMVFEEVAFDKIMEVEQQPLDMETLQSQPGLIGHKIRRGEDLWSIAKRYHTTVNHIMETNHLPDKNVNPGQKIVVVKEIL